MNFWSFCQEITYRGTIPYQIVCFWYAPVSYAIRMPQIDVERTPYSLFHLLRSTTHTKKEIIDVRGLRSFIHVSETVWLSRYGKLKFEPRSDRHILTIHTCVHSYVRLTSSADRMPRKNRSIRMMWFGAVTHIHIDLSSNRLILVAENKCHKLCGHIELFLHIWQWLIIKRSCSRHHCRIHSTSNLKWWFGNPFRLIRSDSVYVCLMSEVASWERNRWCAPSKRPCVVYSM